MQTLPVVLNFKHDVYEMQGRADLFFLLNTPIKMRWTIGGFKKHSSREGPREQPPLLGNLYSIIALNQGSTPLKAEIR